MFLSLKVWHRLSPVLAWAFILVSGVSHADTVQFSGRVIDAEHAGIKDAYVFLYEIAYAPASGQTQRSLVGKTQTDSEGNFAFSTGKSTMDACKNAVVLATAPQRSMRWVPWTLHEDKHAVLQLGDYESFSGVVRDTEGKPVCDVTVRAKLNLRSPDAEALYCFDWLTEKTDMSGRFSFNFVPKDAVALFCVEDTHQLVSDNYRNLLFPYQAGDRTIELTVYEVSRISGVCIGSDQKSIAGIELNVSGQAAFGSGSASAVTDAEGRFSLMVPGGGICTLCLSPAETNAGWTAEPLTLFVGKGQDKPDVVFSVSKAASVEISVVDVDTGRTIPDAFISIQRKSDGTYGGSAPYADYHPRGRTKQTFNVPAGVYEYSVYAQDYAPFSSAEVFTVREGESLTLRASLKPQPVLRGVVRDADGKAVAGMELTAMPDGGRAITDQNGLFSIAYMPGEHDLYLRGFLDNGTVNVGVLQPFQDDQKNIEVKAIRTVPLKGRVLNPAGNPVQDAQGYLYLETGTTRLSLYAVELTTEGDGAFSVSVIPGLRYELVVSGDDYRSISKTIEVPKDTSRVELDPFRLGVLTVTGSVVDDAAKPVEGVKVFVYDVLKSKLTEPEYRVRPAGQAVTDAAGRYTVERTDPDSDAKHSMVVAVREEYAVGVRSVSQFDEQVKPIVIESRPKSFSGRIVDFQGRPIAGATVSAYVSSYAAADQDYMTNTQVKLAQTEWLRSLTDTNGRFVISGVPRFSKGEFSIEAEGYSKLVTWDTRFGIREATIPAGKADIVFVLYKTGLIQGRVLGHDTHKPLVGEKVFITPRMDGGAVTVWSAMSGTHVAVRPEGNSFELLTDEQGMFVTPSLSPGRYRVALDTFSSPSRRWCAVPLEIDVAEGQTMPIELVAVPVGTVRVLVVEQGSRSPVAGARVALALKETSARQDKDGAPPKTITLGSVSFVPAGKSTEDAEVLSLVDDGSVRETVVPARTGSDGIAELFVAPGVYSVSSVVRSNFQWIPKEETLHAESGRIVQVTVEIQPQPEERTIAEKAIDLQRGVMGPSRHVGVSHAPSPVKQTPIAEEDDSPLFPIEIVLVDEATREPIDYARADVDVSLEGGKEVTIKRDAEGRFRARVKAGRCLVSGTGYPAYDYTQNIEMIVQPDRENLIVVPLYKYPIVEGVIALPDSVSIDDLIVDVQPGGPLTLFRDDFQIAGDGEFSCKITLHSGSVEGKPSHGWLWVHTKDHRYVSRTKFALQDGRVDIALQPEATILFKKTPRYSSIMTMAVHQDEYDNLSTVSHDHGPDKGMIIDNEEYIGLRGLIAGQDDLRYEVNVFNLSRNPVVVPSKELKPGEKTIRELPAR